MMNILALSLVVSSLAAAGVWSPTPQRENVTVKDGRRAMVVEHDEGGKRNTKVSISSPPSQQLPKQGEYLGNEGNEAIKEAASTLPKLGQRISPQGKAGPERYSPRKLTCDAFGKCTRTFATAFGKAKDKVSETAHEAKERVKDTAAESAHEAKEKVSDTTHEVKEKVSESAHEAKDKVAATAQQTKEDLGDALGKAKDRVAQKGQDVKESAKESTDKAKDTVKTAKETAKTVGDHIVQNVTDKGETLREKATEEAKEVRENTERAARKAKTSATKLFDVLKDMTTMEALNSVMGMANLLGLATAHGMGMWVTFISSNVLAGVLPRQQFRVVQSKIYPVYFRATPYSIGLALLGHFLRHRKALFCSKPEMFQAFNLLSSFFMVLVNALYLEPKATKVMFERMKMEKEEGRGRDGFVVDESRATEPPSKTREANSSVATISEEEVVKSRIARLNDMLKKLNRNSSLLNVVTLMGLTWHLVYLGLHLSFNC